MTSHQHPFERALSVTAEEIEFTLKGHAPIPWLDFWLNPRRLRGSDFLMRWSQGRWSEDRIVEALNQTADYITIPYGLSSVAPQGVRDYELYWERLEQAGLSGIKRPDLLVFQKADLATVQQLVQTLGGLQELPFVSEAQSDMRALLAQAVLALECENSLWIARQMPDYSKPLRPQRRLGGKLGLQKNAVLPNVFLKEEDRALLNAWQAQAGVPIHIWQVFYDLAIGVALDRAEALIAEGLIEPTVQVFQATGGATQKKAVYKIYQHYTYPVGTAGKEPDLVAASITDKNGHILPYVRFEGGSMALDPAVLRVLGEVSSHAG